MEFKELFDFYEEQIPQISEVTTAEEKLREAIGRVSFYSRELADSVDTIAGMLARAYEAQGFNGGLAVARGTL